MRHIYLKIFLSFLAVLIVNLLLATFFIARFTTNNFNNNLQAQLLGSARIVASLAAEIGLDTGRRADLQDEITRIGRRMDMRITVILPDGTVAADSHEAPEAMDNHADRQEVRLALADGEGVSRRHSETLSLEMAYAAVPITRRGETLGVVRVALPEASIREALFAGVYRSTFYGACIALAIAAILSLFMARQYSRPIQLIKNAALKIAAGDFQSRLAFQRQDELSQVAETLNELSATLGQSYKTLHDEQARLQAMLGGISEQMVFIGSDQVVYMANASFCRLFALDYDEVAGRPYPEILLHAGIQKFIQDALDDRTKQNREFNLDSPDGGDSLHFRLSASPVTTAAGRFRGVIILFHDTSHLHEMEKMRREFVDNASHELKTPLSSILAVIDTLEDNEPRDPAIRAKFLNTIKSNAERLHNLINDLLDLSEIEQKKANLEFAPADICGLVREAAGDFLPAFEAKNIRVQFELPPAAVEIPVDRKHLRTVITNLLDNANRYTDDGGIVTLRVVQSPQSIRIDVQDTGIGIAPRDQERIFERFYRVDKARSIKSGGTGLGLSIAKHIIEAHSGRLTVQSTPGLGSVFSIFLPVIVAASGKPPYNHKQAD